MPEQQMKRVDSIAYWLKNSNSDILVLQEAFHNRARKRLIKVLQNGYPYHVGPEKGGLLKTNSGVMIFSRDSLTNLSIKRFKHATGSDQLAYKSGGSCQLEFSKKKIQLIGTHLQAGYGQMLKILHAHTIDPKSDIRHTTNNSDNPFFKSKGAPRLIDYVLLENRSRAFIEGLSILTPSANWSKKTNTFPTIML